MILRQCVSCRESFDRDTLLRILKEHKSGEHILNPDKYQFGKSIYLCKKQECIEGFKKNKRYKLKKEILEEIDQK